MVRLSRVCTKSDDFFHVELAGYSSLNHRQFGGIGTVVVCHVVEPVLFHLPSNLGYTLLLGEEHDICDRAHT